MSPKSHSLAIDDEKEQIQEDFVPELNIVIHTRNKALLPKEVEVKGMFLVSF